MEPLHITDPKLDAKIQRAIADLERFYPDRVVSRLEKEHKGLANRLGEAAKEVGYPSRRELMEAYGFKLTSRASAGAVGGHPVITDASEVFIELRQRYRSKPLPKATSALVEENPDLAGKLKTLANKSKQLFGKPFRDVLIEEGLLAGEPRKNAQEKSKAQVDDMLEDLRELYADAITKPKTIKKLASEHPEYSDELEALTRHCKEWYGVTPLKHLKELGILSKGVNDIDQTAQDTALDELTRIFASRSNSDKPRTVKALVREVPEFEAQIASLKKSWRSSSGVTFTEMLRERGILGYSDSALREQRKKMVALCVRNAEIADLVDVWFRSGGADVLVDKEVSGSLPPRIIAIDVTERIELRETVVCASARSSCQLETCEELSFEASGMSLVFSSSEGGVRVTIPYGPFEESVYREIAEGRSDLVKSQALEPLEVAVVVGMNECADGSRFVQIRMRYLHALTVQTMLNLLVRAGLIDDDDLLGGDAWRKRDYAAYELPTFYRRDSCVGGCPESANDTSVLNSGGRDDVGDEESDDERQAILQMLQIAAITAAIGGDGLPQDVLDDLQRATDGDESVDLEDLMRRVNDVMPSIVSADPDNWTYGQGLCGSTPQFSLAVPDGYKIIEGYAEGGLIELKRHFVAVPAEAEDKDIPNCDRIMAIDSSAILSQGYPLDHVMENGIDELYLAMKRNAAYCSAVESAPRILNEQLVEARNCQCLLQLIPASNSDGFEYYLHPLALGVTDWLRVTFYNASFDDEPRIRPYVIKLASTLDVSDKKQSALQRQFSRCQTERVGAEDFVSAVIGLGRVLGICRNFENESNQAKAQQGLVSLTTLDIVKVIVEGVSAFNENAFSYCEQAVDALRFQMEHGAAGTEFDQMIDAVKQLHESFESHLDAGDDPEVEAALRKVGDIRLPSRYRKVAQAIEEIERDRISAREDRSVEDSSNHGSEAGATDAVKPQNDADKSGVSTDATQEGDTPREMEAWRGSNLLTTAVEAALEELKQSRAGEYVGSDFVSQSEKIIGSILSQQQVEADLIARKRYESGEDIKLLLSLHKELGYVLCHVLDAYLDCIEGKCKAGCDSDSLKIMLAEVEDVADLVKQDPSISDSKLGKVKIGKARIPAELKELDARREELKKKADQRKKQEIANRIEERRKQKIEKLEKRLTRERRSLEKIHYVFQEQELTELETKAKVAENRIEDLQKERDSLGLLKFAKKRELSDKIESQQREMEKLEAKITSLRAEVEESRQRESQLRASIADLERELAELRDDDGK